MRPSASIFFSSALAALLSLVLTLRSAAAHPLLQDSLELVLSKEAVIVAVQSTLRPIVVAARAKPRRGAYFEPDELEALIRAHARYLLAHLTLRADGRQLLGTVEVARPAVPITGPVHQHLDLERWHARYELNYPLASAPSLISIEQSMLTESADSPPWRLNYVVSVRYAGDPRLLAAGLLGQEDGFDFHTNLAALPARVSRVSFVSYAWHGMRHIWRGWDHLLFVSALVLASRSLWDLVKVVLSFTVAHSLTLTLAALGLVSVPAWLVEPLIALSIVVISLANLRDVERGLGSLRLLTAFGFGLVHGLGFAGPLIDALRSASGRELATGILGFSVGVEIGQQLLVIPLYVGLAWLGRRAANPTSIRVRQFGSLLTALGGVFFLVRALYSYGFRA